MSGKGVPAALYSSFVGEVVRGRTFRRRFTPELGSPANLLTSLNRILYERQLEEYYCTLCYAAFDLKRRTVSIANSGLPYPVYVSGDDGRQLELPGLPLGSFGASSYEEINIDLKADDIFVFCSDGISETFNADGEEFGSPRVVATVLEHRAESAKQIVAAVFGAMIPRISPRGRLGVQTNDLTPQLAEYFGAKDGGVLVTSISKDSPAEKAGLKAGDVITSVNGEHVRHADELIDGLRDSKSAEVTIGILRDKKESSVKATIEQPETRIVRPGRPV